MFTAKDLSLHTNVDSNSKLPPHTSLLLELAEGVPIHLCSQYSQVAQGVLVEKEKNRSVVSHHVCASGGHTVPLSLPSPGL